MFALAETYGPCLAAYVCVSIGSKTGETIAIVDVLFSGEEVTGNSMFALGETTTGRTRCF